MAGLIFMKVAIFTGVKIRLSMKTTARWSTFYPRNCTASDPIQMGARLLFTRNHCIKNNF